MKGSLLVAVGCLGLALFAACGGGGDGAGATGGSGGGAGDAGDAGGAGGASDAGCPPDPAPDDPAYGCGASDCAPCNSTHGTPGCSANQCTLSCDAGFGDCDGDLSNGCETDLSSDPGACGACGKVCPADQGCTAGSCQAVCGDGKIAGSEQCDDGNTDNLDGCDATCRYETLMRMTSLIVEDGAAPSYCTPGTNAFGKVFPAGVVDLVNSDLDDSLKVASLNLMLEFSGLDDLTGQNQASISLGILSAALDPKHTGGWSEGAIDYWFLADAASIDAQGNPVAFIPAASLTGGELSADAAQVVLPFGGSTLELLAAHLRASVDAVPAPDVPAPPPAALAPGLVVFRTLTATDAAQGLCGNATVSSLAKVPLPHSFASGGISPCVAPSTVTCLSPPTITSHAYTWCGEHCGNPGDPDYDASGCDSCDPDRCHTNPVGPGCNSLLDAVVGGCVVNPPDCVEAFLPTQPDIGTGGQSPKPLSNDPTQNDKVTPSVATDGYSSYFRFAANRAHLTNNSQ
jgi:cysteine-rich repeat protein